MTLALYRRHRPGTFAEVIGQEHVTGPLQQALRSGRVHHAYLFSGPRGCGKTSSARILARSLNCVDGPTPTPCGTCDSCVALAPNGPGSLDVVEIDAASHGLVEDARELRERAAYAPVSSRFKVYIIDEAHMVTTQGFNALLKLVEEPPPHLMFVFATTEPDKVIGTIRSRTFHYPFRLVPPQILREHLAAICTREGVQVDPLVLPVVVRASGGSVRDALSILDQLLAGVDPKKGLSYAEAVALLGYTDAALLDELVDALAAHDGAAVFELVDRIVEAGHDPRRFALDLLERLRDLIVVAAIPDAGDKGVIDAPADAIDRMRGQAGRFGQAELSRAADIVNEGCTEMRGATSPRLLLELICARLLLPAAARDGGAMLSRVERLERRMSIETPAAEVSARPPAAEVSARPPAREEAKEQQKQPAAEEQPSSSDGALDAAAIRRVWPDVLAAVKTRKRTAFAMLNQDAQVIDVRGNVLVLSFAHPGIARQFTAQGQTDVLVAALREVVGVDWMIETVGDDGAAGDKGSTGKKGRAAPAADRFDDGDAPDDGDVTIDVTAPTGEEAAVALLEEGLGARVIGEVDAS